MFTRQIPQNFKSVTVKIAGIPKNRRYFLVGHSDWRLGKQVTAFSRHTKTLVGKLGKITDKEKSEESEVGNGKNYQHPVNSPIFLGKHFLERPLCRNVSGILLYKFWRIFPGIFLEDFSGHFFPQK